MEEIIKTTAEKIFDDFCRMNKKYISRDIVVNDLIIELIETQKIVTKLFYHERTYHIDDVMDKCVYQIQKIEIIVSIFPIICIQDDNLSNLAMAYDMFNNTVNCDLYDRVSEFVLSGQDVLKK